ncbi:DUF5919 domain-containing protein [Micromonospora eburnea]
MQPTSHSRVGPETVGLSITLLCQDYADRRWQALLASGAQVRCLFLDPLGDSGPRVGGRLPRRPALGAFVIRRDRPGTGLFPMFEQVFESQWQRGRAL